MATISARRVTAYACYLAFRHADRANQRGHIGSVTFDAVSEALRAKVAPVWEDLFPGQEACAYMWVLDRVKMFERDGVLTNAVAVRVRAAVGDKARPGGRNDWGALALLWRIHLLYRLVIEVSEQGDISSRMVERAKEAMHALALSALNREVREAAPAGREVLNRVLGCATSIVEELVTSNTIPLAQGQILTASLSGRLPGGPEPVRGGANISAANGTCLVCGEAFEYRMVVYCAACDTPHHPDCWAYNLRCAMFACGCVDSTPRPGGPTTPRFDLESPTPKPRPRPPTPPPRDPGDSFARAVVFVVVLCGIVLLATVR